MNANTSRNIITYPMQMVSFNNALRNIRSLIDCTDKTIVLKNESFVLTRMNASISKQGIELIPKGHGYANTIIISNSKTLVVIKYDDIKSKLFFSNRQDGSTEVYTIGTNYEECQIPAHVVRDIFPLTLKRLFPKYIWNDSVITIYSPNIFSGFDENGTPEYKRECYLRFVSDEYVHRFTNINTNEEEEDKLAEEWIESAEESY